LPEVRMEPVIQSVAHYDPPACRDIQLLQLQADSQWAEDTEHRIRDAAASDGGAEPAQLSNKVNLISFRSGKGELFRKMLLQDNEFKPLRKSLKDVGYPLILQPSKTIVLVRPDQYLTTVNSPTLQSQNLRRYKVLVAESEEHLMDAVLWRMASKQRPRENKGERVELELSLQFVTERTFICEAPRLLIASSVLQSTTEAVRSKASASVQSEAEAAVFPKSSASSSYFAHTRSRNPRRHAVGRWGE